MSKALVSLILVVMSALSFGAGAEDQPRALNTAVNLRHHAENIYSGDEPLSSDLTRPGGRGGNLRGFDYTSA